jgi:hypothetical protein
METAQADVNITIKYQKAPILRRIAAFLIDAVVAFIPALAMYLVFTGGYSGWTPIWYESPVIAAVTMYDLPGEVNEKLNTFDNEDGVTTHQEYNVSFTATVCRVMSVVSILFYVFYSTFCAYIFDGKTVGKKLMGLRMILKDPGSEPEDEEQKKAWQKKNNLHIFVREVVGKVLLNSIPVFPVISFFTMIFTKERKTLHDMMGKTIVVQEVPTVN